jgi:hypothetical protein
MVGAEPKYRIVDVIYEDEEQGDDPRERARSSSVASV